MRGTLEREKWNEMTPDEQKKLEEYEARKSTKAILRRARRLLTFSGVTNPAKRLRNQVITNVNDKDKYGN